MFFESERDRQRYFRISDNVCSAHFHQSMEFLCVLEGRKEVLLEGQSLRLDEGQVLIVQPCELHTYLPSSGRQLCVTLPAEVCAEYLTRTRNLRLGQSVLLAEDAKELQKCLLALQGCPNEILFSGLAGCILGLLLEKLPLVRATPPADDRIREIIAYIEAHCFENLTLGGLAATFGYSRCYFSTLFRRLTKDSLTRYINAVRVRNSLPLLKRYRVGEVYMHCGFGSPQMYFKCFRELYGCTPGQYVRAKNATERTP